MWRRRPDYPCSSTAGTPTRTSWVSCHSNSFRPIRGSDTEGLLCSTDVMRRNRERCVGGVVRVPVLITPGCSPSGDLKGTLEGIRVALQEAFTVKVPLAAGLQSKGSSGYRCTRLTGRPRTRRRWWTSTFTSASTAGEEVMSHPQATNKITDRKRCTSFIY